MFGKVAVLMGGSSAEREISLQSGNLVQEVLIAKGVDAVKIDPAEGGIEELINGKFDRAFIALHGRGGEDGKIQGLLHYLKIPYTGSSVLGSALAMDKVRSKRIWQSIGISTPPFMIWHPNANVKEFINIFGLPLCVKPALEGSSIGITKVTKMAELEPACRTASLYGEVMIEPWIIGDEYALGILGDMTLPTVQINPSHESFYDYNAKYVSRKTNYVCPAPLDKQEEENLNRDAMRAFRAINANGWGRLDYIRDLNGDFWLLELNTVPGLTSHSLIPMAANAIGIEFSDLIVKILENVVEIEPSVSHVS